MSEITTILGALLTDESVRDAIHIAVAPVVAVENLFPGQHVGFVKEGNTADVGTACKAKIGIVDPFLTEPVQRGQRFWMLLYPNTITSLRHEWIHPAFGVVAKPAAAHRVDSEAWLRTFAAEMDIGYQGLMDAATQWVEREEYTVQQGSERWRDSFGNAKEFWHHYEIVTGTKVKDHEATFFCCTC